jgi:hypothetical protein
LPTKHKAQVQTPVLQKQNKTPNGFELQLLAGSKGHNKE